MIFNRVWAMPNHETFSIKPIREFVLRYLNESKVSVDPYSRNTQWATYTNDLNTETSAQSHVDAIEYLESLVVKGVQADLVIIDPPYSPRQIKECYDKIGLRMKQEEALIGATKASRSDAISSLMPNGGTVLTFGWNTNGMGIKHDFEIIEILLVAHGSDHNDTICMAERRVR